MADFCLQVLEFGDIGQWVVGGISKADLAAVFELDFLAPDQDFLSSGEREEAAVGAGVDQKEAIAPSFNSCVLAGCLAVYNEQFAPKIPANSQNGGLVV